MWQARVSFPVRDITDPASYAEAAADIVMLNDCLDYFDETTVKRIIA